MSNAPDKRKRTEDEILQDELETPRPAPRRGDHEHAGEVRKFVIEAARLMKDLHCTDIIAFDVRQFSDVTDYVMVATGTSDRQIHSVSGDLNDLARSFDMGRFGREVDERSTWLVADFVDVVVHLFDADTRAHYDLEMMWGDAPKVQWQRPDGEKPSPA